MTPQTRSSSNTHIPDHLYGAVTFIAFIGSPYQSQHRSQERPLNDLHFAIVQLEIQATANVED
jgi:hypothetical protein